MSQPIGLQEWEPRGDSLVLIDQVREVLDAYRVHLPLTARQVFYRLVGAYHYDKTELAYKRLLDKLNRARRAGLIPFSALRDDGVTEVSASGWDGPDSVIRAIIGSARSYSREDLQIGQDAYIELWVEAAGMVPQAFRVSEEYTVPVYSSGGFNSTTMKHAAAQRFQERWWDEEQGTIVLHVGDHDPSGVAIFDNLDRDVRAIACDLGMGGTAFDEIEFVRLAVTQDQADEFGLESAPPKSTDSRSVNWSGETYQAEALDPGDLADIIRAGITDRIDHATFGEQQDRQEEEREQIAARLRIAFPDEDI